MTLRPLILMAACAALGMAACQKPQEVTVAGKGGTSVLYVHPVHGILEPLDSVRVYIRYNTHDLPSDGRYDDSTLANMVDGKPMASFTDLTRGNYFIFAKGYNPTHQAMVQGSAPVHINDNGKPFHLNVALDHQ